MISNCGHDENGSYAGGRAGDQTGTEYQLRSWYDRPWDVCLRCTDQTVRKMIASLATDAAQNDKIGYDQGTKGNTDDRYSFWKQLTISGYYPKNIKTACETDCSNSTLSIVKAVGYLLDIDALKKVSIYGYTGNLESILLNTGLFKALRDSKYLKSDDNLYAGDILLCTGHHVTINVTDGASIQKGEWYESRITVGLNGLVVLADQLNLRAGPGTVYKKVGTAKKGTLLFPSGKTYYLGKLWFHCSAGWFSGSYEEGWIQEENNRWWYLQNGGVWPKSEVMKIGDQEYAFDSQGWMITADRIAPDGHITE